MIDSIILSVNRYIVVGLLGDVSVEGAPCGGVRTRRAAVGGGARLHQPRRAVEHLHTRATTCSSDSGRDSHL